MMGELFGPRNRDGRGRRKPVQLCFEAMESRLLLATTFLVTTAADNGDNLNPTPGSLRQAILNTNTATEPATIDFQIGSGGFQTISPFSPLPTIRKQVTIDGTSQPGYTGFPLIEIDGFFAGPNANGLTISAGSSTVQGLDIVRFSGNGIDLNSKGGDVIISNIIGTDASGDLLGNTGSGVLIDSVSNNVIGGTAIGARNVISGNVGDGVLITRSNDNLVQGNYIGTDFTGTQLLINAGNGVEISFSGQNTIGGTTPGAGNVISGNVGDGVGCDVRATLGTLEAD